MTKTFKELGELDGLIGALYTEKPELKDTKFGYAYKRFAEKWFYPVYKEYQEALTDLRVDNALIDETTKAILTDNTQHGRGFKYSKDGFKTLLKAERELVKKWDAKEVECEPFFVAPENLPEDLSDEQIEAFKGILVE